MRVVAFLAACLASAEAHAVLTRVGLIGRSRTALDPTYPATGIKLQPFASAQTIANGGCGGITNRDRGVSVPTVAFAPGAQIEVEWSYTIPHPADVIDTGVRVALHVSPADSFAANILAGGITGDPGFAPPAGVVPAATPANAPAGSLQTLTVTLPTKTCNYCTLQWVWAAQQDGGSYVGCADIAITADGLLPDYAQVPISERCPPGQTCALPGLPGAVFAEGTPPPPPGSLPPGELPLPNTGVRGEEAGGIGAGSFFLGFLLGIAAVLGYQWADRKGHVDKAKQFAKQKLQTAKDMNEARKAVAGAAPTAAKLARKAESLGLVQVEMQPAGKQPAPPQKTKPAAPMPDGWTEETDPASGRTYFYNHKSGESAWVRPK